MLLTITYIKSYFKPVIKETSDQIQITIRGITLRGNSWPEIFEKVQLTIDSLKKQLNFNSSHTINMSMSSGTHGKWNVGAVMLKNTLKTLEAFQEFSDKNI
ncbi:hypothetical protein [Desulfosporosinus sp. OT]|uniref:hypothetical protein n=1 Tax=Desulfosporosinus sp. OT TaxID=913865 RepID=UPI000223AC6E|nr:hypothetical protein [Desulfosporosinus sp. OT]EGW37654.1 hypothetical protein DOT_4500 [Desulfosporosinus sp. OT]